MTASVVLQATVAAAALVGWWWMAHCRRRRAEGDALTGEPTFRHMDRVITRTNGCPSKVEPFRRGRV